MKLKLATATGQWVQGEHNNHWVIKDEKENLLFELDGDFDEVSTMQAIRLGRKFELIAYNAGIAYGKDIARKEYINEKSMLLVNNQILSEMNERLSEELDKQINKI